MVKSNILLLVLACDAKDPPIVKQIFSLHLIPLNFLLTFSHAHSKFVPLGVHFFTKSGNRDRLNDPTKRKRHCHKLSFCVSCTLYLST